MLGSARQGFKTQGANLSAPGGNPVPHARASLKPMGSTVLHQGQSSKIVRDSTEADMLREFTALACLFLAIMVSGCGPMHMPMPPRLDAGGQAALDDAWNRATRELHRLDHQQLLDALMNSHAYQVGVDRFSLRSEKHCEAGLVVMEIRFDRADLSSDCFMFTLYDKGGAIVRHERYTRDDVERTYEELFVELSRLEYLAQHGALSTKDQHRREVFQARLDAASSLIPETDEQHNHSRQE